MTWAVLFSLPWWSCHRKRRNKNVQFQLYLWMRWSLKASYGYCSADYKSYWKPMKSRAALGWIFITFWDADIVCVSLILLWFHFRPEILVCILLKSAYDFQSKFPYRCLKKKYTKYQGRELNFAFERHLVTGLNYENW